MKRTDWKQFGFTLVELLVVSGILALLVGGLGSGLRIALSAYARVEAGILQSNEGQVFLFQLSRELRNAVPYAPQPFLGEKDSITFPARLKHYSEKGEEENLFLVQYSIKARALVRTEKSLKQDIRKPKKITEPLLENLKTAQFDFLYLNPAGTPEWRDHWPNKPYVGLPRGVRLKLAGGAFKETEQTIEILLPQGVLLERYR